MNRKTWIGVAMIAVLVLCAVGAAMAQQRNFDPAQMVERQITAMKERLKLSDDQAAKIKTILTDGMKAQAEMRKKYNIEPGQQPSDEAREAMMKAREEQNKKINEVLTADQKPEYQKMLEERRNMGPGGGAGGRRKKQ